MPAYVAKQLLGDVPNRENNHQWLDYNGWGFKTAILVDRNNRLYEAKLNIAKSKDGRKILYDINKIKNIGQATLLLSDNSRMSSLTNTDVADSISDNEPSVNTSNEIKSLAIVELQ